MSPVPIYPQNHIFKSNKVTRCYHCLFSLFYSFGNANQMIITSRAFEPFFIFIYWNNLISCLNDFIQVWNTSESIYKSFNVFCFCKYLPSKCSIFLFGPFFLWTMHISYASDEKNALIGTCTLLSYIVIIVSSLLNLTCITHSNSKTIKLEIS